MRIGLKFGLSIALWASGVCLTRAQDLTRQDGTYSHLQNISSNSNRENARTLTSDDRLSLIAAALDETPHRRSERDCSHLVHAIYEQAGFPYRYAPSSEIYVGIEEFRRVKRPQPGDLVVWRGHVGIVIKPSQHIFFSYLRSGPGTDDYDAVYWKSRGHARFYRYIKDSCHDCDSPGPRRLVSIKK
jgi:cell wall-associated NlpC family hydrolase